MILNRIEHGASLIRVEYGPRDRRNVRRRPMLNMQNDTGMCQHVCVPVSSSGRARDEYSVFDQMSPDFDSARQPGTSAGGRDVDGIRLPKRLAFSMSKFSRN